MSRFDTATSRLRGLTVLARLKDLEAGLEEQRQLGRRVAELTDLVTELLVPLAERDQESLDEIVERYRRSL